MKNKEEIIFGAGEVYMYEFTEKEITLEYSNKTVKPTHILVVATSSKYGDYFAGAVGSVLWLDDVELVYE